MLIEPWQHWQDLLATDCTLEALVSNEPLALLPALQVWLATAVDGMTASASAQILHAADQCLAVLRQTNALLSHATASSALVAALGDATAHASVVATVAALAKDSHRLLQADTFHDALTQAAHFAVAVARSQLASAPTAAVAANMAQLALAHLPKHHGPAATAALTAAAAATVPALAVPVSGPDATVRPATRLAMLSAVLAQAPQDVLLHPIAPGVCLITQPCAEVLSSCCTDATVPCRSKAIEALRNWLNCLAALGRPDLLSPQLLDPIADVVLANYDHPVTKVSSRVDAVFVKLLELAQVLPQLVVHKLHAFTHCPALPEQP